MRGGLVPGDEARLGSHPKQHLPAVSQDSHSEHAPQAAGKQPQVATASARAAVQHSMPIHTSHTSTIALHRLHLLQVKISMKIHTPVLLCDCHPQAAQMHQGI
jgi:hypothetical protein